MPCIHLQQLYRLCQEHDLTLGSSDLIRVVCNQCNEIEVCPSVLMDEYDGRHAALEPGENAAVIDSTPS